MTVDTVCSLLCSADKYIQYKSTNLLVQKVLVFIDSHGNSVLNTGSFTQLPYHVVCLILAREELRAEELYKFQAALMWSQKFSWSSKQPLLEVLNPFLRFIKFHKIPARILMTEIYPLDLVPHT